MAEQEEEIKIASVKGSTHYDLDFKQHLKVVNGKLLYLNSVGSWQLSAHRLGVDAIGYESAIIEVITND